jgi:hypothetical protein
MIMAYARPKTATSAAPSTVSPSAAPAAPATSDAPAAPAPTAQGAAPGGAPGRTQRPQKANPFKLEHFVGEAKVIAVRRKATKDADTMESVVDLGVVQGKDGLWAATAKGEPVKWSVSVKRTIIADLPLARAPVAYLKREVDGQEPMYVDLFKQQSQAGAIYMRGSNRDTGEVYLLFAQTPKGE